MDKAGWHEFLVYALNRPLAFAIMHLAARLGRAAHLPLIGTFVNDAEIAREVLTDTAHFDSHSAGSLGVLVTQALGPYALLNMDGPEHRQLKRRLLDVFSTKYISLLLSTVTDPLIAELKTDLAAGRTVDFVAFMKTFASAMACAMIGVAVEPADQRRAYDDMFALATEFTALAGLGKRRLSAAETAKAHHLTDRLAAHIRNSYDSETLRENSLTQQMRALGFPFEAAKGVVIIVMIGATELITYGVPRMLALLVDSGQMAKLRAHPDLLDRAVDEGFRMVTPSNVVLRAVTADCEVRGVRFRRGTRVLVVFRTIMRRDRHFPNGKRFDIERTIDPRFRRLLFGAGPHACLGTGLALAEARQVLDAMRTLDDEIEIVARRYNRGQTYPGYSALAIRLRRNVAARGAVVGENSAQLETQQSRATHAPGPGQSHIQSDGLTDATPANQALGMRPLGPGRLGPQPATTLRSTAVR
jgi:cytochrome P450